MSDLLFEDDDNSTLPDMAYQGGDWNTRTGQYESVMPDVAYQGDVNNPDNVSSNKYVEPYNATLFGSVSDPGLFDKLKGFASNLYTTNGALDFAKIATLLGGGLGALNANKGMQGGAGAGYQGGIPKLYAGRTMMTAPPTMIDGKPRRPGQGGINYGGNVTYFSTKPEAPANPLASFPSQSAGAKAALAKGMTADQYTKNIMDWLQAHPNASDAEVRAQMDAMGISVADVAQAKKEDLALIQGRYDNAFKQGTAEQKARAYKMLLDQGLTDEQIRTAIEGTAGRQADTDWSYLQNLSRGNQSNNQNNQAPARSAGLASAIQQGMTEQQYLTNIENWLNTNKNATDRQVADQMVQYGISADDLVRAHPSFKLDEVKQKLRDLGVQGYAEGGKARYLQGETDGMADEIPSSIGGREPAALSHGEFVIPADVVSHLGNGNSDAGAKKLYQMMDKLRMARTGTKKQGKKINPDKFMPGGLAKAYAEGGAVKHFQTGGTTSVGGAVNAGVTGLESNLSNWAGPYVTDMLAKGMALSEMPYQAYTGPLTAGQSALQQKVSTGLQGVNFPGNLGQSFASSTPTGAITMPTDIGTYSAQQKADLYNKFRGQGYGDQAIRQAAGTQTDTDWKNLQDLAAKSGPMNIPQQQGIAGSYMNPYLQNVLQPQLAELNRQSQINLQPGLAKLTAAGGYGGGRQAIMESEANRNLLQEQNKTIGQGYSNAYDKAMQQFNTEQGQAKTLADMMSGVGATDRAIESEGITADKLQFEEARENPYKMVQFQNSLLQGMPLSSQAYNTTGESAIVAASKGAKTVQELLNALGIKAG
jgi:hypothetical protein